MAFGARNPIGPISPAPRSYFDFKLSRRLAVMEGYQFGQEGEKGQREERAEQLFTTEREKKDSGP